VKLVHLVGFITKKSVTMYGHMKVKLPENFVRTLKHVGVILILILYYLHMH